MIREGLSVLETEAGALHSLANVGCYGVGGSNSEILTFEMDGLGGVSCVQGEDMRNSKSVSRVEMRLDKQAGTRLPGSLCREAHDAQESIPEEAYRQVSQEPPTNYMPITLPVSPLTF